MKIGQVIKKYRKDKGLTQQEMANQLGVSTPAVNKWENGYAYPDITLLAPIARLLGINLDTLLCFEVELSVEEINRLVQELQQILKEKGFDEGFAYAKKQLQQYPNCNWLMWQAAVILEAYALENHLNQNEDEICDWYKKVLESDDETLRYQAANSLFYFYLRKEDYEQAEEYCSYFSIENPTRKHKMAEIYRHTNRNEEAYRTYEECLYAEVQVLNLTLHGLYSLAKQEENFNQMIMLSDKMAGLAKLFEMGTYHENLPYLELATLKKDKERVISLVKKMMENLDSIYGMKDSSLYSHMKFKAIDTTFLEGLKKKMKEGFADEQEYEFLKDDPRWLDLLK